MLKASVTFNNNTDGTIKKKSGSVAVAVQKSLAVLDRNIKVMTPVKHGTLRRSITQRLLTPTSGEIFTASLVDGQEMNYAVFVEFGTRYMAPRAMFRKGIAISEPRIKQIFEEELGKE